MESLVGNFWVEQHGKQIVRQNNASCSKNCTMKMKSFILFPFTIFPLFLSLCFQCAWILFAILHTTGNRGAGKRNQYFILFYFHPQSYLSLSMQQSISIKICDAILLCTVLQYFFSYALDSICIHVKCDALCQHQRMCTAKWCWKCDNCSLDLKYSPSLA